MRGLFLEQSYSHDKNLCLYTLRNEDYLGLPSLYRLYIEMDDPTEYLFAKAYFEDVDHWDQICLQEWFKPYIASWRHELELKVKAHALARIRLEAKSSQNSFQANKFLLSNGWKEKGGKGRPTKADISEAADKLVRVNNQLTEDFERISKDQGAKLN